MRELLPETWTMTKIGEITIDTRQRVPSPDESFVYIDISSVNRDAKRITSPQELLGKDAPSRARKVVQTGDILVSMTRPNLNAVALVPEELDGQIASTGFDVLRTSGIEPRWLFYLVRTTGFVQAMSDLVQGALYPAVRSKDVRAFEMPIAPLNEQERIADKLETLLMRVDACRERLDCVPPILKRFRQAVLASATSGQLTEDWREGTCVDSWREIPLREVATIIDPNPSHRYPSYERGTVPIISTEQFDRRDGYDLSKAKLVTSSFYEERLAAHGFMPHDVVFARKGRLGLARRLPVQGPFVFSHTIFIIRSEEPAVSGYLLWYLRNDQCIEWLLREMHSNQGVPTLGKSFMENLPVRLPPPDEQFEIVRRIEALFTFADRLESRLTTARKQIEHLTPALLAKAFRGDLVPQDPNDEPASVLLERIRSSRASTESTAGPKRRQGSGRSRKSLKTEVLMLTRKDIQPTHLSTLLKESGPLIAEALWTASQLDIDDFYDQLKEEEARGLLKERRDDSSEAPRLLEAIG